MIFTAPAKYRTRSGQLVDVTSRSHGEILQGYYVKGRGLQTWVIRGAYKLGQSYTGDYAEFFSSTSATTAERDFAMDLLERIEVTP